METIQTSITPDVLKKQLEENGKTSLIDVRSKEEYDEQHVPGAIHIPLATLKETAANFDESIVYVTICGKGGGRSSMAAESLRLLGYHALWLAGGTTGWFESNA